MLVGLLVELGTNVPSHFITIIARIDLIRSYVCMIIELYFDVGKFKLVFCVLGTWIMSMMYTVVPLQNCSCPIPVSYTHLTLPTNREV